MTYTIYLSGEIHTAWRDDIIAGITENDLPVQTLSPIVNHDASDNVGTVILGDESDPFWRDHKSAKINALRIRAAINSADIVVVRFDDGVYRQWNAAFDAGYAIAAGKSLITIHPDSAKISHALKEIDAAALATARTTAEVIEILTYICTGP